MGLVEGVARLFLQTTRTDTLAHTATQPNKRVPAGRKLTRFLFRTQTANNLLFIHTTRQI